jgi:RNase P/RNase MRP subunit p30
MLIIKSKEIEEFCKKNKLHFNKQIQFHSANRISAIKKKQNNLLINVGIEKDFMKQKNSGIDEVFCKFAKEHEKRVFIDINEILKSSNKHLIIQKVKQNIRLLKKYKLDYHFIYVCDDIDNIISEQDIAAFRRVLELRDE